MALNAQTKSEIVKDYQTAEGEAMRDDKNYMYSSAWEWQNGENWKLHKEPLEFTEVTPTVRSYK